MSRSLDIDEQVFKVTGSLDGRGEADLRAQLRRCLERGLSPTLDLGEADVLTAGIFRLLCEASDAFRSLGLAMTVVTAAGPLRRACRFESVRKHLDSEEWDSACRAELPAEVTAGATELC